MHSMGQGNALTGTLPAGIAALDLQVLFLQGNAFSGTVPEHSAESFDIPVGFVFPSSKPTKAPTFSPTTFRAPTRDSESSNNTDSPDNGDRSGPRDDGLGSFYIGIASGVAVSGTVFLFGQIFCQRRRGRARKKLKQRARAGIMTTV